MDGFTNILKKLYHQLFMRIYILVIIISNNILLNKYINEFDNHVAWHQEGRAGQRR